MIQAVRVVPAEHRSTIVLVLLALLALIFIGAWAGGHAGASHHQEES